MINKENNLWAEINGKILLLVSLSLALLSHGIIIYFTLPKTYDAFVHMFFADHYARFWFEPWEYRWYTGFLTISYPPLVHQLIALLSKVFPLKVAFGIYAVLIYEVFIIGLYRFTKMFFNKSVAGVAAILGVILPSLIETLHVFGQVPTLTGLGFLLNALPFLYQYLVKRKVIYLVMSLSFLSVVISSHHVTVIFGMVFFIAPTIFMALADSLPDEKLNAGYIKFLWNIVVAAIKKYKQIMLIGGLTILLAITLIFPYWYWSKTDPITQVSIPHGSRDNFFENTASGLVFYVIPLALIFALLPAIVKKITEQRRFFAWAVSFFMCLLLGSGATTPLPKILLGENAFNILTLDRFGFWASIIAVPFMAHFIFSYVSGPIKEFWIKNFGKSTHFLLSTFSALAYMLFLIFIFHLASFRPLQPKEIDIQPIQNFLNRDEHMRWRYLTLGFGDQMAWLSANSLAATVDGNYHSARRLPELTSRPIERLENAKFTGLEGLASLTDFLTYSEKYNLKYVFSNDRYYDPLLYYAGWNRTIRLENGITVWEKGNISTIRPVEPKTIHPAMRYMWGVFPVSSLLIAIGLAFFYMVKYKEKNYFVSEPASNYFYPISVTYPTSLLPVLFFSFFMFNQIFELLFVEKKGTPEISVMNYYNELDFQRFENAFGYFNPSPAYTIDQYLLEKSVNDGGLLPSYAKLDSIYVNAISRLGDTSDVRVYTKWNTSLGQLDKEEIIRLVEKENGWYIIPDVFIPEIPDEQMRSYTYTLFKKQGKRVISSFPTVKDDRIKKPFAVFKQAALISAKDKYYITGEILNTDNIPVNIAVTAKVKFESSNPRNYYPSTAMLYNLAPKGETYFQIDLDDRVLMDSLKIKSIEVYAGTDVSERGYIQGGAPGYSVKDLGNDTVNISVSYYNQLTTDINIPGILVAEKDSSGTIWQTKLYTHPKSLRSGLHNRFDIQFLKVRNSSKKIEDIPLTIFINGKAHSVNSHYYDPAAAMNNGISILPHCFISQEIYLQ